LIAGKVGQHLRDLESWRSEQIVSADEYHSLRKRYQPLLEREDAWILEARRLTLPQVTLYLGAWVLAVGAAFLTFFPYPALARAPAVLIAWAAALPVAWIGVGNWRPGRFRVMPHTFCQSCESRRNCGADPLVRAGPPRPAFRQ
jgi:hypothetical protein